MARVAITVLTVAAYLAAVVLLEGPAEPWAPLEPWARYCSDLIGAC